MRRRSDLSMRAARAAWSAVVVGMVLAIPTAARAAAGTTVVIHQYQYHEASITVPAGTAVTWTNQDSAKHDVTTSSGPASFASPLLATGESFTYTFDAPGTYQYLCSIHPDMLGSVSVTAAPVTSAPATTAPPVATTASPTATTGPPGGATADPGSTTTTTAAVTSNLPAASSPAATLVPAAAVRDDLSSSARPYLLLLALAVAVVVAAVGLLVVAPRGGPPDRAADG